jgi:hypothetical protein
MIILLLLALTLIAANVVVLKKISNKFFRYLLIFIFSATAIGIFWMMWMAARSGEM